MHLKWYPRCTETISKIELTNSLPSECRSLQHLSWYTGARKCFTCLSRKYNRILFSIHSLYMSIKTPTRWSSALSHGLMEEMVISTRPRFMAAFQKVVYAINFTTVHPPRPDHRSVYPSKVGDEGMNLGRKYNRFLCSRKITVQRVVQLDL